MLLTITLTGCGSPKTPSDLLENGFEVDTTDDGSQYVFNSYDGVTNVSLFYYDFTGEDNGISIQFDNDESEGYYNILTNGDIYCQGYETGGNTLANCKPVLTGLEEDIDNAGAKSQLSALMSVYQEQAGIEL